MANDKRSIKVKLRRGETFIAFNLIVFCKVFSWCCSKNSRKKIEGVNDRMICALIKKDENLETLQVCQ